MRILILTNYYSPDMGPAAPLFTSLSEKLCELGHEIIVLTSVPHYPSGYVSGIYRMNKIMRSIENGVKVIRVPLPSVDRSNLIKRLYQFLAFQIMTTFESRKYDFDVFLTHTPALEVWLPYVWFSSIRKKPSIYLVYDVYPGVGISSGIIRNKVLISIISSLEKSCLKRADKVRVISKSFINELKALGVSESKMTLIYDWANIKAI